MTDLTRQCLALRKDRREYLIKILTDSLNNEREDDGSRFSLLYKVATEICGNGILTQCRDFKLVMARRMIAYKMRKEGYSLSSIGRYLLRNHASVKHQVLMMQDAIDFKFQYELALWELFNQKVAEYEKEMESNVV